MKDIPYDDVLRPWGLEFRKSRPDLPLSGSPERCLFRTVIEDGEGRHFVLEEIQHALRHRKREIAAAVEFLAAGGLSGVIPCLRNCCNDFTTEAAGGIWQIAPFVEGLELERPDYTQDAWRGRSLARFLVSMKGLSAGTPSGDPARPFSVAGFIRDLMRRMKRHNPLQARAVEPAFLFLEGCFFPLSDHLPVAFCHGDFHPLNVIWGDDGIRAVIDWEFSGYKPEIYDAALLLGCLGVEDPESLAGPMALAFVEEIRAAACFDASGFVLLPEFVLALRFAWLSDWLRKKDVQMVELEADFIGILLENMGDLRQLWA